MKWGSLVGPRAGRSRQVGSRLDGFTLVELLIAAAVLGILLAALTAFFALQTRVSGDMQSRSQLDTNVRLVAEIVMQDLQQAGSLATYTGSGVPQYLDTGGLLPADCTRETKTGCVVVGLDGSLVTVYYATSLVRPTPSTNTWAQGGPASCRRVDYDIVDDVFFRRDTLCDDTSTSFDDFAFATGIDAAGLTVNFICHQPNVPVTSPTECYDSGTYPREAIVTVAGTWEGRRTITSNLRLSTSVPNLRPPVDYLELVGD